MVLAVGKPPPAVKLTTTGIQPSESEGTLSLVVRIPLQSCGKWAKAEHQSLFDFVVGPPTVSQDVELRAFFKLLEDGVIQQFLHSDRCAKIADKYLLAMVYVYFRRANLTLDQYTRVNFFAALFLAHDMEEDQQREKYQILLWSLQHQPSGSACPKLLVQRDTLWRQMDYRAYVKKEFCETVFALSPEHPAWKRERLPHHGGAHRTHTDMQVVVKHSNASSQICDKCEASGLAERTSQWCSSSGVCPSLSSNLLPYKPRRHRQSISAPLDKKRKMKIGYE